MDGTQVGISRRNLVLAAAAGALAAPFVLRAGRASAQAGELTFVTWGGSYKAALEEGIVKPFTAETGIRVNIVDTPDLAKVKAQVMTGNVQWDVFDAPGSLATAGAKQGYWEAIDPALFDLADLQLKPTANLVPLYTYAGGIAWDPKRFGEGRHPRTFRDYFDLEKFPGRRTFRDRPSETLEAALLGDGVDPKNLYPLDVDRAYAALDRIKSSVASWVAATPQTITLLQSGEVDFSYSYAGRVKTANASGAGMAFSFDQTINAVEYLAVLKGAPNRENAFKFVSYALRPEAQAKTMEALGYMPLSLKAVPMLSDDARKWIGDLNGPDNVTMDDMWWGDHFEDVTRRFKEWVLT